MPITIRTDGSYKGATSHTEVLRSLAIQNAARVADAVTALTNNSGGTAGTVTKHTAFVNVANASTNLADTTETNAALDTVHDGLRELYTKANEFATALGITGITYNGGGASADGTLGAITVTVAAAATGAQASNMNTTCDALDNAFWQLSRLVNKLCVATGRAKVAVSSDFDLAVSDTIAAITISEGSAADPGVTKAAVDAALAAYRVNVKTLGDKLVAISGTLAPLVIAE